MSRLRISLLALGATMVSLTALATTASGSSDQKYAVSGKLSWVGIWSGPEQKNFQQVLNAFQKKFPGVSVKYTSAGDNTATVLSTAVAGGNPPDLASIAQPGLVAQFSARKAIKPIDFVKGTMAKYYTPSWLTLGTYSGHLYGMLMKGSNKSMIWYSVPAFKNAGVKPPKTWTELLAAAKTLRASGTPAYSIDGGDGWPLTDLFENVYLRVAGPAKYDQLAKHTIKWTDPSVIETLKTMAQVYGDTGNIYGGTAGALQTLLADSVNNVFSKPPKAAMVMEGDFVPTAATVKAKPLVDYNQFPFPSVKGSPPSVVGSGDSVVMFKDTPAARALISYLATPEAATIWAKLGGFSSPNKGVPASAYPNALQRAAATALAQAKIFRFDMSDLAPAAFGGTPGQGEWKALQDFLKNPKDVTGTAKKLETAAAAAYKK
jgi:ABC-type glycerol-3-phosphate transport system substrate-binding protein